MRLPTALVCFCAGFAVTTEAGKFPPVSVRCTDTGFKLQVDADGLTDVCVGSARPACPKGLRLQIDFDKDHDACLAASASADKPSQPTCPPKLELKRGKGEDACVGRTAAHCPSGYSLKVMQGEDMCLP